MPVSSPFKVSDFRRAVRAAKAEGLPVAGVKVTKSGSIEVVVGKPAADIPAGDINEWDTVA